MADLEQRITALSAAKRELLARRTVVAPGRRVARSDPPLLMSVAELAAEAALDPAIAPSSVPDRRRTAEPAVLLLTGATGFLGAFLLDELLAATSAHIHCLVRGPAADSLQRIADNLRFYGLDPSCVERRVTAVAGDLSEPRLGLDPAAFASLAGQLDGIVHCGAAVKWTYPYSALKPANVAGTREVLRLATVRAPLPVHFVSTVGVFSSAAGGPELVSESEPLERSGPLAVGYAQSKWVAEQMVRTAAARGLPVSIHRPAIGGDSRSGAFNRSDHISLAVKGCIQLGCAPESDLPVQIMPVDVVAKAIVYLSRRRDLLGRTFHLVNENAVTWTALFDMVAAGGYPLRRAPFAEWERTLRERARSPADNALFGLVPFLSGTLRGARLARFGCAATLDALSGSGIACPPIDCELMGTYLRCFVEAGFLEPPHDRPRVRPPPGHTGAATTQSMSGAPTSADNGEGWR